MLCEGGRIKMDLDEGKWCKLKRKRGAEGSGAGEM